VEDRSGEETKLKKVITFQRAMTKKVVIFSKYKVTPSVATPGDTNPSDVTGLLIRKIL